MINDPDMPNPVFIIAVFVLALLIVRVFTTTIHELGHAIAALVLTKGNIDVYIGTYGDPEKGRCFKIGRLTFYFLYAPFSLAQGVVMHKGTSNYFRDFIITLAGPVASLLASLACIYFAVFADLNPVWQMGFYILATSAFTDFWYNIKYDTEPIHLHDGKIAYNDGYMLRYNWFLMKSKS